MITGIERQQRSQIGPLSGHSRDAPQIRQGDGNPMATRPPSMFRTGPIREDLRRWTKSERVESWVPVGTRRER